MAATLIRTTARAAPTRTFTTAPALAARYPTYQAAASQYDALKRADFHYVETTSKLPRAKMNHTPTEVASTAASSTARGWAEAGASKAWAPGTSFGSTRRSRFGVFTE